MEEHILLFIRKNIKLLNYNQKQIQHISSKKCGKFVIAFILSQMYGRNILDAFASNLSVNEIIVENILAYLNEQRRMVMKI